MSPASDQVALPCVFLGNQIYSFFQGFVCLRVPKDAIEDLWVRNTPDKIVPDDLSAVVVSVFTP